MNSKAANRSHRTLRQIVSRIAAEYRVDIGLEKPHIFEGYPELKEKFLRIPELVHWLCKECIETSGLPDSYEPYGFYLPFQSGMFGGIKRRAAEYIVVFFETEVYFYHLLQGHFESTKVEPHRSLYDLPGGRTDLNILYGPADEEGKVKRYPARSEFLPRLIEEIGARYIALGREKPNDIQISWFLFWLGRAATRLLAEAGEIDMQVALERRYWAWDDDEANCD